MSYMSFIHPRLFLNKNFVNILIALIPISFIAGNLIINLNILLIILFSFFFFKNEIFSIKYITVDKLIIFAFSFVLVSGFFNTAQILLNEENIQNFKVLTKSISYQRYLLLYLIVRFLVEKDELNFKYFFISSFFCSSFVCLDLIYQFIFGVDIFGYKELASVYSKFSGPFGDELIAGSYLQKFGFFSFFFIPFFLQIKNKKILYISTITIFILMFFSMIIAGNRMPFILFIGILLLVFLLEKKTRKYFLAISFTTALTFSLTYSLNVSTKTYFNQFFYSAIEIKNSSINFFTKDFSEEEKKLFEEDPQLFIPNTYVKEFYSGVATWKENKILGGGVDSFYSNCIKVINDCASHPHNYYLEILSELGIIGLVTFILIFIKIFYDTFCCKYLRKMEFNYILIPFMYLFLVEVFPIKTTGSFFTTSSASFFFFIVAVNVALSKRAN